MQTFDTTKTNTKIINNTEPYYCYKITIIILIKFLQVKKMRFARNITTQ